MSEVDWHKARPFLVWTILVVLLAGIFAFILKQSESYGSCVHEKKADYAQEKFQENEGRFISVMDRRSKAYITCFWKFAEGNNGAFVAIETLFLALFTLALWIVTGTAARAARDSANALPILERAYVFIVTEVEPSSKTNLTDIGEIVIGVGSYKAGFLLVNHGKTPATVLEVRFSAEVVHGKDEFPEYSKSLIDSPVVLAAGEEFPGKSGKRRIIDPPKEYETIEEFRHNVTTKDVCAPDQPKIPSGEAFIIVMVKIVYRDIFKTIQETAHCRIYDGKDRVYQNHGGDKYNYST